MVSEKQKQLIEIIEQLQSAIVCFSGGTDSTVLLTLVARTLRERCVALTSTGAWTPDWELEYAKQTADHLKRRYGIEHVLIPSRLMENPLFVQNDSRRCYYCKQSLFATAHKVRLDKHIAAIVDGTHRDDLKEYRPGLEAAQQAGIRHPFVEAELTKHEILQWAKELGIEVNDNVGSCCIATRIPRGTEITFEHLAQVQAFEKALRSMGFRQLRVRHHGELARIELGKRELNMFFSGFSQQERTYVEAIIEAGKEAGFQYITMDLQGYRKS